MRIDQVAASDLPWPTKAEQIQGAVTATLMTVGGDAEPPIRIGVTEWATEVNKMVAFYISGQEGMLDVGPIRTTRASLDAHCYE